MKRVDTSEATTSRGAEEVGPAGLPTPLEPGVTWSVVLGVSEGGGKEGRATTLGWEGVGREGWWDESKGDREGDSRSMSGSGGRNIVQRCPKGAGWGEELKWKWKWNERKGGNKKKKKQNNNNVTKKKKDSWCDKEPQYNTSTTLTKLTKREGLHMQIYTHLSNARAVGAEHSVTHLTFTSSGFPANHWH